MLGYVGGGVEFILTPKHAVPHLNPGRKIKSFGVFPLGGGEYILLSFLLLNVEIS